MTAAATAARPNTDRLPNTPCTHNGGRVVLNGIEYARRCLAPEGHAALDLPHAWSRWTETGRTITEEFEPNEIF